VGHNENPPIEKILSLKPDLILGFRGQKTSYSLLSTIAPTVMIENIETSRGFKEELKHLAEILDRKDEVERILTEYNRRVQEFRQQLGEKLKTKLVSVLYIHTFLFGVYRPEFTIYGQIMNDVGIQFLPAYKHLKKDVYTTLSIETLPEWDADFVFILLTYKTHPEDFEMMLKKPIWSALKAVQNKRVYAVKWSSTVVGPITAIQFLDDLEKYLVKQVD
jgi:iron complex transport system substrate-binding protein